MRYISQVYDTSKQQYEEEYKDDMNTGEIEEFF